MVNTTDGSKNRSKLQNFAAAFLNKSDNIRTHPLSLLGKRNFYKPFEYEWAYLYYKRMQDLHWLPSEVPLQEDLRDWIEKLSDHERALLTQLFRFFTQADVGIADGYYERYSPEFKLPEFRMLFGAIIASEANHIDSYSSLIDQLGMPEAIYQQFAEYAEMREKHEYLFASRDTSPSGRKWTKKERLALDLGVFSAFGEGVQLFSSFAILLSFKNRNLMKGMSTIVEWSIRDETLHVEAMTKIFRTLIQENPKLWTDELKQAIYQTCRDMVKLEDLFIDLCFAMGVIPGITADETKQYIRNIADRRLLQLGLKPNYNVENPFDWIAPLITAQTHTNFFEGRSTEYSKGGIENWDKAFDFLNSGPVVAPIEGQDFKAVVYTKDGCPFCFVLKHELAVRRIDFTEIDLTDDTVRGMFYENTGTNTVPQLYITNEIYTETNPSGERIGGWSEAKNRLDLLGIGLSAATIH
ncbi:ribonucleoside-diphosphate reductase subunit beta [Sphingobium phage Lacusarx]|uniref:ribonucleoside-diphosphate reductase n=1 Tax=Sphingobium phage Lacusarx TaxID=1980139 RepID=A0A1W6DWY8_9CAUD|nr:ribonucleoside-diphosphate reductase subunit beta [Sphingobium phage Lacusarx]ARK07433.1 ribonucleoside-diphosphate reductase subunit beta [Sphingobium phage Lacusarx]